MVEFINKLTESQTSDKVRKVLRSDPDRQKDQQKQEKSDAEKKEEKEEPHDEVVLSGEAKITNEDSPDRQNETNDETKSVAPETDKFDGNNEDGHIDVTV